jgi:hypothetical protein
MTSQAKSLASQVANDAGDDRAKKIASAFLRTLGRTPEESERRAADELLGTAPTVAKWEQFCQALLNTNEFVYVE